MLAWQIKKIVLTFYHTQVSILFKSATQIYFKASFSYLSFFIGKNCYFCPEIKEMYEKGCHKVVDSLAT